MIIFITAVIILTCLVLGFFVLVQNPKGGGLAGNFGSLGAQVMGVKQSTDVMEKGTWAGIGIIAALCIVVVMAYEKPPKQSQQKAPAQKSAPAAPAKGNG